MTTKAFFAYGSFCQGFVHHEKIQSLVRHLEAGSVKATCYRLKSGFPVLVDEGNDLVSGEFILAELSPTQEAFIDELNGYNPQFPEKSLSVKKVASVFLASGETREATIYFLNPFKLTAGCQKISGGDWRSVLQNDGTMVSKLSDRQRNYIQKLGQSSGREIVPIDLPLYRELMGLELIIDKGRRLALSKLGQEVFRYLG